MVELEEVHQSNTGRLLMAVLTWSRREAYVMNSRSNNHGISCLSYCCSPSSTSFIPKKIAKRLVVASHFALSSSA